jgi:hypothetical protein
MLLSTVDAEERFYTTLMIQKISVVSDTLFAADLLEY